MPEEESGDFSYADDAELVEQFVTWTTDAVNELKTIVTELDGSEVKSDEKAARIYDLTHNIKGMGGSFDFPLMTFAGGSLCSYIKDLSDDKNLSARVIDAHVKVFDVVLAHKIQGDGGEKGVALQNRLMAIISEEP